MADITTLPDQRRDPRLRLALVAVLVVTFIAAMVAEAGATVKFEHQTDPAGDRTVFTYTLLPQDGSTPDVVQLSGDGAYSSYGPGPGIYVMQASPPAGWRVASIQCTDQTGSTASFQIDLANGRVTVDHTGPDPIPENNHHVCAFTHARVSGSGVPGARTTGIAPTPITGKAGTGNAAASRPTRSAVSGVKAERRSAIATVRLARRAVIRATLLSGRRVVGARRVVRASGEHEVRVDVPRREARRLRAKGRSRATLRLRVVIAEQGGATRVFDIGVRVRL